MLLTLAALAQPVFVDVPQALSMRAQGAVIVDARGATGWLKGRIPGVGALSWWAMRVGALRTGVLSADLELLLEQLQRAGVRQDSPVVVVGDAHQGWGEEGRIFWTLEVLGHPDVHILDGGVAAWKAAGQPLRRFGRSRARSSGDFEPRLPQTGRAELARVQQAWERGDAVIWDTRSVAEFHGATPAGEKRGGHIPGAKNLFWKQLLDAQGFLLPEPALRELLQSAGIADQGPVITLCTGGVRAGFAYAVLRELGYSEPLVYDGSMWEWSAQADLPLEL